MVPPLRRATAKYAALTAVTAAVTQPIPFVDEIAVLSLHYWFAWSFIRQRGNRPGQAPWWRVNAIIWGGVGARIASRFTLGFVPPAGSVANGVTSAAVTVLVARCLDRRLPAPSL